MHGLLRSWLRRSRWQVSTAAEAVVGVERATEGGLVIAVVHDRYGSRDVLRLEHVERPTPKQDEVLVRIHATTVSRSDCGWRSGKPFVSRFFTGLLRPKRNILGCELAGEVEAVGDAVRDFEVGDRVFGRSGFGANAEFICMRESDPLAHMPTGMTFEEAAAVCDGAILALPYLRRANLHKGQRQPDMSKRRRRPGTSS